MFGSMGVSDHGVKNLVETLEQNLDRELDLWLPRVPANTEVVTCGLRSEIIEWLIKLKDKFDFSFETFFLAVDIFDRFLSRVKAQVKYVRCIAVTCLYLAAKVSEEDEVIPLTWEVAKRSECGCSEAELLRMERCILDKLDWNLRSSPTTYEFIHLFYALVLDKCPRRLTPAAGQAGHDILDQVLMSCLDHADLMIFCPSTVALSTISLYLELTWDLWLPATQAIQAFIEVKDNELSECRSVILHCLRFKLIHILTSNHIKSTSQRSSSLVSIRKPNNPQIITQLDETHWPALPRPALPITPVPLLPSLSLTPHSLPLTTDPLTPHPPAKRRKVEQDDDAYDDIRKLYDSAESPCAASSVIEPVGVTVASSVTLMSCASEAERINSIVRSVALLAET